MRNLNCCFTFAVIVPILIILLSGCSVGIKPRSYDVPPEDEVYYEESVHSSYYDAGFRPSTYYYSDPNYDPWTMGTYYQHYSGPPRSDVSSGSSGASNAPSGNRRPAVKGRDSTSIRQSQAPASGEKASRREDRSTIRERRSTRPEISDSARRKARREREASQKKEPTDDSSAKRRRSETRQRSQETQREDVEQENKEEDKEKKKKSQN